MSDRYTRAGFLRRAAAGGTVLTVPGLLAACGGGGGVGVARPPRRRETLPKTITWSNWPLYIDINEKTKKHPSLAAFEKKYGVNVKLRGGHQRQRHVLREDPGAALAGPVRRAGHRRPHRCVGHPGADDRARLAREARPLGAAEHLEPPAGAAASRLGPESRVQPAVAVGHDGDRLRPEKDRRRDRHDRAAAHRPEAEGQGDDAHRVRRHDGARMLANGDDPSKVTDASFDRAIKTLKKAVDSGQIRQFTGNDYAPLLAKGDVWAAPRGRATWCSSRPTIRD